jgi:undecaprenyl-diphosphatase
MFNALVNSVTFFFERAGSFAYPMLFLVAFLERAAFTGAILPGGYVLMIAGLLSAHGYLDALDCVAVAVAGALAGDFGGYTLGRKLGRDYFRRHSRLLLLKRRHVELAEDYFREQGGKTVLIGRFISVLHMVVPFVAGLSRMPFRRFLGFDVAGNIGWAALFVGLGYLLGYTSLHMGGWLLALGLFFLVLLGTFITSYMLHRTYRREKG